MASEGGPPQPPSWEPIQMPPLVTSASAPGNPLVLSPFPTTPVVAGAAGPGPHNPGPCKLIIQVSPEAGLVESSQNQPVILTQAPLNWGAAEAPTAVAGHAAPLYLVSSGPETIMTTPATTVTQAGTEDHRPQAPLPVAHVAPIILPSSSGTLTQWVCGNIGPVATQSQAPPESSSSPNSVYENFRRWQCFKALTQRHLPQIPDTEALSCFFIPVLRTLARLKPTMSLEEGLHRALREWQSTSNFDRMIYYDMAAKFMEFEAEEKMEVQKLQWTTGVQGLPLPAPPRPGPQGAPGPPPDQQTACVPKKARLQARAARPKTHQPQQPPKTKAPKEIPPEAVQEYMDIMDELLKAPDSVCQQAVDRKEQQEEAETWPEPGILSYMDELCSQEAFVTKVEAILHPSFLEYLLSPESQLDLLDMAEELEKEEGLTPTQIVEKRLQASQNKKVMQARPQHQMTLKDSSPAKTAAGHGPSTPTWGHRPGTSTESCLPETDSGHASRSGWVEVTVMAPGAPASSLGSLESPPLQAGPVPCPSLTTPTLESRAPRMLGEAPSGWGSLGAAEGSAEEKEDLTSLAFLLTSQNSLLPWGLPTSPCPDTGPKTGPDLPGRQEDPELPSTRTRAFKSKAPTRKRPLCGGPRRRTTEKTPCPRGHPRVSRGSALTVELMGPSLPPKRRFQPAMAQRRRRGHKRRFKDYEEQEEKEVQEPNRVEGLPPPTPPRPELQEAPGPPPAQQPACVPNTDSLCDTQKDSCPPETDSGHASRPERAEVTVMAPGASAHSLGSLEAPPLQSGPALCPSLTASTLDSRAPRMLGEASPGPVSFGAAEGSSEEKEELTSLVFVQASHNSLLPSGLPRSPGPDTGPDTGPHLPGGQGNPELPSTRTRAFKSKAPTRKSPVCRRRRRRTAEKTPCPRGHPRVCWVSALTEELEGPSLPPKRRFQPAMAQRRRRGHKRRFKDYEEQEEKEVQEPNSVEGLPPPTPPRPELQEAPGPPPAQQPACVPNTDSLCDTQKDSCPPETDSGHASRPERAEVTVMAPGASAPSLGSLEAPPLQSGPALCPSLTASTLDSRAPRMLGEASPGPVSFGAAEGSSEEKEELTSLVFVQASHNSLLPSGLPRSPGPDTGPDTGPHLPGGQGNPELPSTRTRAFKSKAPTRKSPVCRRRRRRTAEKTPCPRGHPRVCWVSALTEELEGPSLPPKRRFQPAMAQRRRRGHKRRFKEYEEQEKMEVQTPNVVQGLPPPTPPRPELQEAPGPTPAQQPACVPNTDSLCDTQKDSCPPETDSGHASRPERAEVTVMAPGASAPSLGSLEAPPLQSGPALCPSLTASTLDSRAPRMLGEASPGPVSFGAAEGSSEEKEELTSLVFVQASHNSLLPSGLPRSPGPDTGPDTGPHLPGGQGNPELPSTRTRAFKSKAPTRKSPVCRRRRRRTAEKTPCPRGHPRVCWVSALTEELEGPSLPPKRRFQPAMAQRRRRGHKRQ